MHSDSARQNIIKMWIPVEWDSKNIPSVHCPSFLQEREGSCPNRYVQRAVVIEYILQIRTLMTLKCLSNLQTVNGLPQHSDREWAVSNNNIKADELHSLKKICIFSENVIFHE